MTHGATADLDALRGQVRAAQHVRSFPLLVLGGLLVNYGIINFLGQPVAWRYGAPLAFVLLWALGKLNEAKVGIGPARADFARATSDGLLATAGSLVVATGVVAIVAAVYISNGLTVSSEGVLEQSWPNELISVVGAVFAAAGLFLYRREPVEA